MEILYLMSYINHNISSKIKSKIAKGRINNLNINFNNAIVNAPLSNIIQNLNFNVWKLI